MAGIQRGGTRILAVAAMVMFVFFFFAGTAKADTGLAVTPYAVGQNSNITITGWNYSAPYAQYNLELTQSGVLISNIADVQADSNGFIKYIWNVGTSTLGDNYAVLMTSKKDSSQMYSNAFSISGNPPPICASGFIYDPTSQTCKAICFATPTDPMGANCTGSGGIVITLPSGGGGGDNTPIPEYISHLYVKTCPDSAASDPNCQKSAKTDIGMKVTDTKAILWGEGGPDSELTPSLHTTGYFRYSPMTIPPIFCNDIYGPGMHSTDDFDLGDGTGGVRLFNKQVTDLAPDTTYYYCAVVSNAKSIVYGAVKSFHTAQCISCQQTKVTTDNPMVLGPNSVSLKGYFSAVHDVTSYFQYRKTPTDTIAIPEGNTPWITATGSIKNNPTSSYTANGFANSSGYPMYTLSGLDPSTDYQARLVACVSPMTMDSNGECVRPQGTSGGGEEVAGNIKNFTTKAAPPSGGNGNIICQQTGNCPPDLVASAVSPSSAVVGTTTAFSATITNQGDQSTVINFPYLFQKEQIVAGASPTIIDIPAEKALALAKGSRETVSSAMYFDAQGTWQVRACADKTSASDQYGVVDEGPNHAGESNNCGPWTTVTVSNRPISQYCLDHPNDTNMCPPDLTAGPVTPNFANAGTPATFSSIISNIGSSSVELPFKNLFQLDNDSNHANGVADIGTSTAQPIGAGKSTSVSISYTLPAGTFYVRACADMANANDTYGSVDEGPDRKGENNNCGSWTKVTVYPAPPTPPMTPDLIAGQVSPNAVSAGVLTTFSASIINQGTASTRTDFPYLFQKQQVIAGAAPVITDVYFGRTSTLDAGTSRTVSAPISLPSTGTWQVRACADKAGANNSGFIKESNENNNCGPWSNIAVATPPSPGPDLTASVVYSDNSPVSGQNITYQATITNQGTASTGTDFFNQFQVADAAGGKGTITKAPSQKMSALPAGESGTIEYSFLPPSTGTWSIRVCADVNGDVTETNENNNCGSWANIYIRTPYSPPGPPNWDGTNWNGHWTSPDGTDYWNTNPFGSGTFSGWTWHGNDGSTWQGGTVDNGNFNGGTWTGPDGEIWDGGTLSNGTWSGGSWIARGGNWTGGSWNNGVWSGGTWTDGTNTWTGGTWSNGTWFGGNWNGQTGGSGQGSGGQNGGQGGGQGSGGQGTQIGQHAIPPSDAIVRYHEGIETVFARQIVNRADLAAKLGYKDGMNLQQFAWTVADNLARHSFAYISPQGVEVRVSYPDVAAYELRLSGDTLLVYEYYNDVIVDIRNTTTVFKNKSYYEYYFQK